MRAIFDFTGESDGNFPIADEGEQTVKVEAISEEISKSGNPMWLFKLRSKNGGLLYHYCLNQPKKRWMLKKTIESITGQKQPLGEITIDLDNLIGEDFKVLVIHEDYAGVKRAKVADVLIGELTESDSFPESLDQSPF